MSRSFRSRLAVAAPAARRERPSRSAPPTVLVSPHVEQHGDEFGDLSVSLSESYQYALIRAGALPLILPLHTSRRLVAECVRRCDGVLLTGGDDVDPRLYTRRLPATVRRTVEVARGDRDQRERWLIAEALRQRKPMLAICRGIQILNVALGGTLIVDLRLQWPDALNHCRRDRRSEPVHEVRLTPASLLANITGKRRLGVNSTHHQAVDRVAPGLRVVAHALDGVVEALEWQPRLGERRPFLLAVQFHPERLVKRSPAHRKIFRAFVRACVTSRKVSYER